jgi:hypothetical protein
VPPPLQRDQSRAGIPTGTRDDLPQRPRPPGRTLARQPTIARSHVPTASRRLAPPRSSRPPGPAFAAPLRTVRRGLRRGEHLSSLPGGSAPNGTSLRTLLPASGARGRSGVRPLPAPAATLAPGRFRPGLSFSGRPTGVPPEVQPRPFVRRDTGRRAGRRGKQVRGRTTRPAGAGAPASRPPFRPVLQPGRSDRRAGGQVTGPAGLQLPAEAQAPHAGPVGARCGTAKAQRSGSLRVPAAGRRQSVRAARRAGRRRHDDRHYPGRMLPGAPARGRRPGVRLGGRHGAAPRLGTRWKVVSRNTRPRSRTAQAGRQKGRNRPSCC